MGKRGTDIPIAIRDLVIQNWKGDENGKLSNRKIAKKFKWSPPTVDKIVQRYRRTRSIQSQPRTGRPAIITPREEKVIIRKVKVDPSKSAPIINSEIQCQFGKVATNQTIRNILNRSGRKGYYARMKPFINKKNQRKRLNFARLHVSKDISFWKKVLWSDESKFNVFGSDGRKRVWREKNQALRPRYLSATVKHGGGSAMVWGCMCANGVGTLEFIDGIMDQYIYQGILSRNLKSSARNLQLGRHFTFQQDNDPKHSAKSTKEYFVKNKIKLLEWPPQSPDLNPIEHLWEHLDRKIRTSPITSKTILKQRILEEWPKIQADVTLNLVESMPRRLEAVILSKGGPTKY